MPLLIDLQTDFCGSGGDSDTVDFNLSLTRTLPAPIRAVLAAARGAGPLVIQARERHRPKRFDLPANKRLRLQQIGPGGVAVGDMALCGRLLVRGEPGWDSTASRAPGGQASQHR